MFRFVWSSKNDVFYVFVLVIIFFLKVAEPLTLVFYETYLSNCCGLFSTLHRHDCFDYL